MSEVWVVCVPVVECAEFVCVLSVINGVYIPYRSNFSRELNFANESKKAFRSFKFRGITDCSIPHPSRKDIQGFYFH